MNKELKRAFVVGVERVAAWSDLLDEINVFPVADGDTGRNLIMSLTPLRELEKDFEKTNRKLLLSSRGNSGNIANSFFTGLLTANSIEDLYHATKLGREQAWQAVYNPVSGTMLTIFDALADFLEKENIEEHSENVSKLIEHLEKAVLSTPELLPKLKIAGVVDSGALGMYIFLEGFFQSLVDKTHKFRPITKVFKGKLRVSSSFQEETEEGYCVDMVVQLDDDKIENINRISECGESVVIIPHKDYFKVHLHTDNKDEAKEKVKLLGNVVNWSDDNIGTQMEKFKLQKKKQPIHIMTDAAGSVTREDSQQMGITLLDSYIIVGNQSLPETLFPPADLYRSMRKGTKVSTSQASTFERHQHYQSVLDRYKRVLYLCVGSVFTGNYDVATAWKKENDANDRFTVIDSAAASGRLGTIVIATARYATQTDDPEAVIRFAKRAVNKCEEYVFLDRLKYLAAGGRLSKTSAFLGEMLNVKPVISPTAEGAKKVGAVKNQREQLNFAIEKLELSLEKKSSPFIMLEYSDNSSWVKETVQSEVKKLYPFANILLQPLSLTSGVHMGPGTWAITFLPELV